MSLSVWIVRMGRLVSAAALNNRPIVDIMSDDDAGKRAYAKSVHRQHRLSSIPPSIIWMFDWPKRDESQTSDRLRAAHRFVTVGPTSM